MPLSLIFLQVPPECLGVEITIDVAPNVLNIQSEGEVVTVHTDIDYGDVDVSTVYLNGEYINSWKVDNWGNTNIPALVFLFGFPYSPTSSGFHALESLPFANDFCLTSIPSWLIVN